jgi:tetratricopeptide (TPR) repeat protein
MAHAARAHSRACEQRLARSELKLSTPDDHYDYAVTLINRRQLAPALKHLEEALQTTGDGDHIHYAMAICHGLMGETESAAEHLGRAVAIEPRNRTAARNDPDFHTFASAPAVKRILYPDAID